MVTILIIDDEEIIRVLLRFAFEAAGYEVTDAANGRQGLELRLDEFRSCNTTFSSVGCSAMIRPLRIEFPHALYHVTSRGNARQRIVWTDADLSGLAEGNMVRTLS